MSEKEKTACKLIMPPLKNANPLLNHFCLIKYKTTPYTVRMISTISIGKI
jgi:hypothetical protein